MLIFGFLLLFVLLHWIVSIDNIIKGEDFCIESLLAITVLISGILLIYCYGGYSKYPDLLAKKSEILTLEKNVEKIRNALYKERSVLGLENIKQSTNLSKYLELIAIKKAEYNKQLTYYKKAKKLWLFKLFTYYFLIPNDIYKLQELE